MSSRTRLYHPWLWSLPIIALTAALVVAQPPSPLELVRGLREHGQVDLAMEYLKDLEKNPRLTADEKAALSLEKAKCLLDASEDEPDEGTRTGMVTEAKEGLNAFLINHPNHPRMVEALLAVAKLTAMDAKEQLNRARRMDVPPPSENPAEAKAREDAQDKQKLEAAKARPLFLLASKRYTEASDRIRAKLDDKTLDPMIRKTLDREAFEAELAGGINQFNTAETYMPVSRVTGAEKAERNKFLEASKDTFAKLAKGPSTNRTVWVARAWSAEVTYEQDDFTNATAEVTAILKSNVLEAEDGKRLARFFQLRRNYLAALGEKSLPKVIAVEQELRNWLRAYGNPRKPTPEVYAVRYYLARVLQSLAENNIGPPKKDGTPPVISNTARTQLTEAEKLYRALGQSDHDFTTRATRQRMAVVRRLLGEADQPLSSFDTFEKAQMATLIQMSKLATEEAKPKPDEKKVHNLRLSTIAVLERARELATPADNQADVTDVLLRLIYFYRITDQPYQEAVLGDHVARTLTKTTGGKAALAGLFGLNGYLTATRSLRADMDPELLAAARKADRERAMSLARFLDEKFPNDNATDAARHQLASLLMDEKKNYPEAFEILTKIRTGYAQLTNVRLLEGYLVAELLNARADSGLPILPEAKKAEIFKRAVVDLSKAPKPAGVALEAEVRSYISARCRLASLMLAQGRADRKAEAANPGYNQALEISEQTLGAIPTFDCLMTTEGGMKKLNLDGLEMTMLARDAHARALYLRTRALINDGKLDEAEKALAPAIAEVQKTGSVISAEMKGWGTSGDDKDAAQKARILKIAAGVDRAHVEVILAGFRLRVQQGKAAEGAALLDLMVKAGGSIEENLPVLELLGREMAAKMIDLQKKGMKAEAEALGGGLAVLLEKIRAVPKLSSAQLLFIGQMLVAVKKYPEALETLKKVPEPEFVDWKTTTPEKLDARLKEIKKLKEMIENDMIKMLPPEDQAAATTDRAGIVAKKVIPALQGKPKSDYDALSKELVEIEKKLPMGLLQRFPAQMRDFSASQLFIARALKESGQFDEADKLLQAIIGPNDKPSWGSGRLYFRKELASVHEAKAESLKGNVKAANPEWGKALQQWTTLFNIHKSRLTKITPMNTPEEIRQWRNAYADAYFDVQRCLVKANMQLLNPGVPTQATKLQKTFDDVGKRFADMEKDMARQTPPTEWDPDVQHRYADYLKEVPQLLAPYKANSGKLFLERLPGP
jgi:hypothetical protein